MRFLDLTPITSTRPDGALSGQGRGAQVQKVIDCLHTCLPGPLDAVSELVFNLILSAHASTSSAPARPGPVTSRFFGFDEEMWLSGKAAERLEARAENRGEKEVGSKQLLSAWWWPFPVEDGTHGGRECSQTCLPHNLDVVIPTAMMEWAANKLNDPIKLMQWGARRPGT